ncbi:dimethylarginine dimethylaminohydrolase family protein [Psychromonas arctica]|uniref:dimethylarginine dimethylaminohydrolase family protein n=1 Tax=Psychromonas arctica TaxID=168275 RepID=UPI002FD31626
MTQHYVRSATGVLKQVLLCPPTHLDLNPINKIAEDWLDQGQAIDLEKCAAEHQQLISIYESNGVKVELLEATKALDSQVFARDFGFNLKEGYVLGRFKEKVRQEESQKYAAKMRELGVPVIATCEEGVVEGGDFWQLDDKTLAIGVLQRSDEVGIENIRAQLAPLGYRVLSVESKPEYLHLDMIFNIIGEKTAVTYYEGLPTAFQEYLDNAGYDLIKIEEAGVFKHFCNLQALGNKKVISLATNIKVNQALRDRGFTVFELNSTEILKTGGGPHCMTFPVKRT